MAGMKDDRQKGGGCTVFAIIGFVLVLLPVMYVLSVGPAARLHATGYLSRETHFWFYHPIVVAEKSVPDWVQPASVPPSEAASPAQRATPS